MTAHIDILDREERVAGSFWGSVALHVSFAALVLGYSAFEATRKPTMGDTNGGRMGAVAVTPVHSIPLPSRSSTPNPLANPTESQVPAPPPKAKPIPKVKAPEPKAIPIPSKTAPKKPQPVESSVRTTLPQRDLPNQVYSHSGPALSSPMLQMPGAGGVGIGNNNPLGQQFGAYAKLIIDQVGRHWQTTTLNPRIQTAPTVVVTFTINRDGSVPQNSVKIGQTSGILEVDISAQRAVMDAAPFPSLPGGFPHNDAQIELRFELRR